MKYSVTTYKKLMRLVAKEQSVIEKKWEIIEQENIFGLKSTSLIQVSDNFSYQSSLEKKLIRYEEFVEEVEDSERIIDYAIKSVNMINRTERADFIEAYLDTDNVKRKKYLKNIAEEQQRDRRKITKEVNRAIEEALNKKEMIELVDRIKEIARRRNRTEYLEIFDRQKEQGKRRAG